MQTTWLQWRSVPSGQWVLTYMRFSYVVEMCQKVDRVAAASGVVSTADEFQ